ncbi:MAG: signal peptidase II [Candidatus Falkowbacteria bacterium]|nr:signal peptidase II [Candidatus Falkowbacteria bacterium]
MVCLYGTIFFIIIDRLLKVLALKLGYAKVLIGPWLKFSLVKNNNAAFSLNFKFDIVWLSIIITIAALIWLNYSLKKKDYLKSLALAMLCLGAMSNIYDRFVYGAVIDYFNFANLNVFNLADILIVLAAIILLWQEFRNQKKT